jgi:predicted nicotinamide N-methyase
LKLTSNAEKRRFILENTSIAAPPHVPEIRLHLASEAHDLWLKTAEELEVIGLPPPFWAFAWAGGQGLARHILDHREIVAGKRVLDLATGSGLVAIAAALAGAETVTANDIDPFCETAVVLNARLNDVDITLDAQDWLSHDADFSAFDVVLAGDVFYDREMAAGFEPLLRKAAGAGCTVLAGDPGRSYLPPGGMDLLAEYQVEVSRVLEDSEVKRTRVWRIV